MKNSQQTRPVIPSRTLLLPSPHQRCLPLVLAPLMCIALSSVVRADCKEGCTDFGNTFLGDDVFLFEAGNNNTALGVAALQNLTSGDSNTAVGAGALQDSTSGSANVAIGNAALAHNAGGNFNVAIGTNALFSNSTGDGNVAIGLSALTGNSTGTDNTA